MGRGREGNGDSRRYYEWLERAGDDIAAAELLLNSENTLCAAAFHCQQCIEKALKGYILYKTDQHLDGHNLTWLCRQAVKSDRHFEEWLDDSVILNRYYIETRYPADIPLKIDKATVSRAYNMALEMYKFTCLEVYKDAE
jgi:HEPN domain-containing protein